MKISEQMLCVCGCAFLARQLISMRCFLMSVFVCF